MSNMKKKKKKKCNVESYSELGIRSEELGVRKDAVERV